jgi:hypothetical protein
MPEDTAEGAKEWAERDKQREAFVGKLQAVGKGPRRAALEGMG